MTVGEKEYSRDEVLQVVKKMSATRGDGSLVTAVVHRNGVHNDQYLDFMAKVRPGELTSQIIQWLVDDITL
ncbi:hypothetical protein CVT25_002846 [Psilocybe cyanescens]|uniref:Uncharacterized protein n=1 Tax=Psilocybe cyanescens TaxID=93625 RepID=A0A409X502_PSICY|nr:hypothetical protein CVT25_002846 [Psilocybe cyanescens]